MLKTHVAPRMSDAAVKAKTGKPWVEWFALLDKAGARKHSHVSIVAILHQQYGLGAWWEQMVAVSYEQARGLRKPHEKPEGYEIAKTKTFAEPIPAVFDAWNDPEKRRAWLKNAGFEIRKATPEKSLRFTWVDGKTQVTVDFYSAGKLKSRAAVQHSKLPSAKAAAAMKTYWAAQLECLEAFLLKG
jgi:uncharacterized protein YndB with AHSA1/START domain